MTRLNLDKDSAKKPELDPYVAIDVDELYVERTSTKRKTNEPDWNETFSTDLLRSAEEVGFTLFHDATVPPDDFIANCAQDYSSFAGEPKQVLVSGKGQGFRGGARPPKARKISKIIGSPL